MLNVSVHVGAEVANKYTVETFVLESKGTI
jgi:hypothetical protein